MKKIILALTTAVTLSAFAAEKPQIAEGEKAANKPQESYKADVYDFDGKEKIYTYEAERTYQADTMHFKATFKDLKGEVVAEEKAEVKNGEIIRYESERKSAGDKGLVESRNGRLHFTYTNYGKKSSKWEKGQPDTLLSANLLPFIESHWDQLLSKKTVPFRYAVWYRQETIGFEFTLHKDQGNEVVIQMNPSNMFYRSLVKPIFFTYDKKKRQLASIKGRTLPKIKKDGAWRDFDAFIKYSY